MRIDVVTIFPEYVAPLELSLVGKARERGLLDVHVHDLRSWTHDRHRTVDDTPYGGGAGMVMKPEPWGEALDAVIGTAGRAPSRPTLIVPTPSGVPFTQAVAEDLASRAHLVFACGRYEGIDQRVLDHAATRMEVRELSLGDYVLNGGEVAALVVIEAVARLLPGFMGNAESLVEESHQEGLLEYPVYTKPAEWRGLAVPEVLLSGDHARIAAWRREQALRRTAERRPDLLKPASSLEGVEIRAAVPGDAGEIVTVQRAAFATLQRDNPDVDVTELQEGVEDVRGWATEGASVVALSAGRLVGAAWGKARDGHWRIARLAVAPDLHGRGIGRALVQALEQLAPPGIDRVEVMSGAGSRGNLAFYRKLGYRLRGEIEPGVVVLTKRRPGG